MTKEKKKEIQKQVQVNQHVMLGEKDHEHASLMPHQKMMLVHQYVKLLSILTLMLCMERLSQSKRQESFNVYILHGPTSLNDPPTGTYDTGVV